VFVTQLVLRATEKDIRSYFRKKVGCKVNEVILLKDKRTGNHKGCAYIEMGRMEDVNKAVAVAGQPPDFQRFPILVKASEAEKNYVVPASTSIVTASMMGTDTSIAPLFSKDGEIIEAQKVYVGSLDPSVSEEHLFALFSQFGELEKVVMQMDPATLLSRGYAFLSFRSPKEANLAIQTMSNQVLAGRPMKTGWASQSSTIPGVDVVTSDEFPEDASARAQKAFSVLAQLTGSAVASPIPATLSKTAEKALDAAMGVAAAESTSQGGASAVPTVAQARADIAAQIASEGGVVPTLEADKQKLIGGVEEPTQYILVHNMFDKDEETEKSWAEDVKAEFLEECSQFGKINFVTVMSELVGGKIYASFDTIEAAVSCTTNLAGRWFDKRQLRVDYMLVSELPKDHAS
jgi:RNA-binding protein 39